MKRSILALAALVWLPTLAFAQPIHGHPQKAAYASPSEWPAFASCQCHWGAPDVNVFFNGLSGDALVAALKNNALLAHVHSDSSSPFPRYAEVSEPIRLKFSRTFYHAAGKLQAFIGTKGANGSLDATDVVWDATGTSTPPDLSGDPSGIVTFSGSATFVPPVKHGWFVVYIAMEMHFDNGDIIGGGLWDSLYSTVDVNEPEVFSFPILRADCMPVSSRTAANYGEIINDVGGEHQIQGTTPYLPIAPISQPWPLELNSADYGAQGLQPASVEIRADMDFHNGVPGRVLYHADLQPNEHFPFVLDPAVLGDGPHKIAIMRAQTNSEDTETGVSLLVFSVTVDPNAPVVDLGGPIPVTPPPPPPPPPPTWESFLPSFQRLGDQIRVCTADGKCLILGSVR